MATGLVKWWRTRFLAGYKPFSVVGGTAEGSDSEELLACVAPPCNSSPLPPRVLVTPETSSIGGGPSAHTATCSSTPTAQTANDERSNPGNAANPTRQLSFEEFECDVSVAEGDRRRQEFSFTLYDFDGHGKITKDDIAGLVTTIYDTLGASIQVPPCGSKTIKVKLTVSPDQRGTSLATGEPRTYIATTAEVATAVAAATTTTTTTTTTAAAAVAGAAAAAAAAPGTATTVSATISPNANACVKTNNHLPGGGNVVPASSYCCHVKHVASCNHTGHPSRRGPRRRRALRSRGEPERARESHSDEDADNVPRILTVTAATTTTTTTTTTTGTSSPSKQEELRRRVGPVPHPPASPYSNSSEGDVSDESDASPTITPLTPLVTNQRKRSGSMQRQQLLEIIQANMEKNNLSFHASRKRHQSEQLRIPLQNLYDVDPTSPYIERCRQSLAMRQPMAYHKPVREPQQQQQQQQHHHHHHPHNNPSALPKLSSKCRTNGGNLRKQRGQQASHHNAVPPPPPVNSLRNNLQQSTIIAENVNLNTSPVRNNHQQNEQNQDQQQEQQEQQHEYVNNQTSNTNNLNNHQRNDGHFGQSPNSGKVGKKHQLKHATREQDQARAMAQVVRWLEREFSQNAAVASTAGRRHVHKHIHHHYHHYHAEALV